MSSAREKNWNSALKIFSLVSVSNALIELCYLDVTSLLGDWQKSCVKEKGGQGAETRLERLERPVWKYQDRLFGDRRIVISLFLQ